MIELVDEVIAHVKKTKEIELFYPRITALPEVGSKIELGVWHSNTVSAIGEVVSIDEPNRLAMLRIIAGGKKDLS